MGFLDDFGKWGDDYVAGAVLEGTTALQQDVAQLQTALDLSQATLAQTQQDLTNAQSQLQTARADLAASQSNLAAANAKVADLTTRVNNLTATVDSLQQQLTACQQGQPQPTPDPTPPPPAPATLSYGGTLRGTGTGDATTRPRPVWDMVRTYNIGDALAALNKNRGRTVATSFGSMLGGPGWGKNAATVAALESQLKQLPDTPGHIVGDTHEFDNPTKYGPDYTTYLADAAVFKSVVDKVNGARKNKLRIFRCCMAYAFTQPERQIDEFYTRDPQNYDLLAPDVYSVKQVQTSVQKAKQYGKPFIVTEMGPLTSITQVDTGGTTPADSILNYMQYAVPIWEAEPLYRGALWFDKNGSGADLDQFPKSLTYWSSQVTG